MCGYFATCMIALVLLGTLSKGEVIGGYEHAVVNLTTNSFSTEIANAPHFVMFYETK